MRRVLLTGATGFLGARVAEALRVAGAAVTTTARSGGDRPLDLAGPDAGDALCALIAELSPVTVVHLAGLMSGTDAEHEAGTVRPAAALIEALTHRDTPDDGLPDLVLASSLSVYGYAALPAGATVDETTPLATRPEARDAYARAKLAQEALALRAAQRDGLGVRVLRPGAIVGADRAWTSRIGIAKGGAALVLGGGAPLPLVDVDDCARAFALAAAAPLGRSDATVVPGTDGHFEAINVVGRGQPTQAQYLAALPDAPRALSVPWSLLRRGAEAAGLASELVPAARRLPTLVRPEALSARAKPLAYARARAEDRLGWTPEAS